MGLATTSTMPVEKLKTTPWELQREEYGCIQPSLRHMLFLPACVHLLPLILSFTAWKSFSRHWHLLWAAFLISSLAEEKK